MKTIDTKIPLITFLILALSAFVPVLQVILVYLNGALLYPIELLLNTTDISILNWINLIGAVMSLIGYFLASKMGLKILSVCLVAFFLTSYFSFLTENFSYDNYPYFLPFLIQSLIVTTPLYFIGIIKEKRSIK